MDSSAQSRAEAVLAGNPWFARQPAAFQDALLQRGRISRLARGEWIFAEGDEATGLCAVIDGALRLEVAVDDSRTVLINILSMGAVVGQSSRLGGGPRLVTARAARPTDVFRVSDRGLQEICERSDGAWRSIAELVYEQLASTIRMAAAATAFSPRQRILARLAMLAANHPGPAEQPLVLDVAQADLAEMTGLSRKSVNRHLVELEASGLLRLGYGRVTVSPRLADGDGVSWSSVEARLTQAP